MNVCREGENMNMYVVVKRVCVCVCVRPLFLCVCVCAANHLARHTTPTSVTQKMHSQRSSHSLRRRPLEAAREPMRVHSSAEQLELRQEAARGSSRAACEVWRDGEVLPAGMNKECKKECDGVKYTQYSALAVPTHLGHWAGW